MCSKRKATYVMNQVGSTTRALLTILAVSTLAAGLARPAAAQATTAGSWQPPLDIAITYQATRLNRATPSGSFFLQGGAIEAHARFYRGLGVAASITGQHAGSGTTGAAPFDMVVAAFGPRYTYTPTRRTSVFAEALVGEANAFHSVFPGGSGSALTPGNGSTDSASSLALLVGGGLDFKLTPHLAVRAIQADWQRTQLPNAQNNVQNALRIGAGVVFKWGRP